MQEMTGSRWKRTGCSLVWSLELLTPLVTDGDAVPLRVALVREILSFVRSQITYLAHFVV